MGFGSDDATASPGHLDRQVLGSLGVDEELPDGFKPSHDELLFRIRRLEDCLAERTAGDNNCITAHNFPAATRSTAKTVSGTNYVTLFSTHHFSTLHDEVKSPSIVELTKKLPPLRQAKVLFEHYALVLHPNIGVLHIPSGRALMENNYQCFLEGEEPSAADLMLLFSIFAGAALLWSPQLLAKLNATREEARSAFLAYIRTAMCLLDHPHGLIQASTTALVAIGMMAHLVMNTDGFPLKVHMLRHRCLLMSREMEIHRLDTAKSIEARRLKGCDMIDVEVQRRVWWNMVASDWLLAFSGGPQEGAYTFQPRHMNVNLPSNTDDELITAGGIQQVFPLSVPTSMSAFLLRVQGAQLCREIIDTLPSILLDSQYPDYETILELDAKCHRAIDHIPTYFKLDRESIESSRSICEERPYIAWQRISIHFSLNTRLCRLHRPYHLEGVKNPKYAYSHEVCIRSAQKVLELRQALDEVDSDIGIKPARFWVMMHHVFSAALILAMDVSFNPQAPGAEERKAKVLAAYRTLEKSKHDSGYLMEGIQKNLQTLMATLHKQRSRSSAAAPSEPSLGGDGGSVEPDKAPGKDQPSNIAPTVTENEGTFISDAPISDFDLPSEGMLDAGPESSWEKLWSDFAAVAPELDVAQWNTLLEDVDFHPPLDIY
ncbi:hypothetical protein N7492_008551 [Penicillium capsulatum]|uniref:Transcription factor domain-containing protein n=1 Tax=Penicillium capsulatum TaxID=69766 RepID=A0A9W9HSC5_9EURO|nr:hypothetical protein N7492_008551 [Penicillium capsulatum]KAJ6105956.1 hypothetical protein N7512_009473 [Penicillium capsulatum]